MSHFVTVALLPAATPKENIESEVDKIMAPYDENIEVEPYHKHIGNEGRAQMEEHYKTKNTKELVKKMQDWHGRPGGYDPKMGLYYVTTYNPASKWDWWVIGGRWDGRMLGLDEIDDGQGGFNFDDTFHTLKRNSAHIDDIAPDFVPFAFVTPDGKWHEKGKMGWWAVTHGEQPEHEWKKEWENALKKYPNSIAVSLDCHI